MANRYFVNGGVDNNWGTTGNWSTTSGGAGGSAVPLATDDVFFDASSPNCTVNTSNRVALTLNFTGYTNTITMTFGITVSGSVTLASGMTIAGTGFLATNATATLTSNGKTWPNAYTATVGSTTVTLADNWVINGLVTFGTAANNITVNGNQITCNGGITHGGSTGIISGTTLLLLAGTGTITGPSSTGALRLPITINTSGTYTFAAAAFRYDTGTLTYTAGTVVTSGSTLTCASGTTFDCAGITWAAVTLSGAATYTMTGALNVSGLLTLGNGSTGVTTLNGANVNASGGVTLSVTSGSIANASTSTLVLSGTGTVNSSGLTTGAILCKVTINASSGTVTFASPVRLDMARVQFTAGTVITDVGTWASGSGGVTTPIIRAGQFGVQSF